jgi:peptide/nickel transport system substrate-binding protein
MLTRTTSNRRIGGAIAALAVAALLITGCAPAAPAEQTLTVAIDGSFLSEGKMDIHSSQMSVTALVLRNTFDSLVAENADGTFSPWLATSWELSDDQLHYTFTLREDVTFTDGEPFNAEAVKANFDHVVAPSTASAEAASMIGFNADGGAYLDTEVVDEFTVRVNFSSPYSPFLAGVSATQLGMYSPKVLAASADQLATGGPDVTVGSGPFVLSTYTPNQELVFTPNADYNWSPEGAAHTGPPTLTSLTMRILPEASVRAGALASGEVQVATNITPSTVSTLGDAVTVNSIELPGMPYALYINHTNGVFADLRVREAFQLGFDVDSAVKSIFFEQFPRAWSILGPTTPNAYDASLEGTWPFNQAKANELLDAAGWTGRDSENYRTKDGVRLSADWVAYTPITDDNASLATVIQSDLKSIGFEIVREPLEPAAYNKRYMAGSFDITDWSNSAVDADIVRPALHTNGFTNASHVSVPELDALLDDAFAAADPAVRAGLYAEVQQWNAQNIAIVPLYVPAAITASGKAVTGLTFDLQGRPNFAGVSISSAQ